MKRNLLLTAFALAAAASANAQDMRIVRGAPFKTLLSREDSNAPRIGVYIGSDGMKDTAGVLVNSVMKDSPADKAGLKEGDRITSINGVNLKKSRDDADDPSLGDMMTNRLTRELGKLKAGDDVDLRVASGSNTKSVKIKTVAARDLDTGTLKLTDKFPQLTKLHALEERAALGIGLGGSTSKRDTLGVFVTSVSPDGPAEKAGIVEGDRIAKINGVDLRVQGPEAGESNMAHAMVSRFNRELAKLKSGDAVTLTVVSGGRSREVKITTVKPSDLHGGDGFFFGDGAFIMPNVNFEKFNNFDWDSFPNLKNLKTIPPGEIRRFEFPNGTGADFKFDDAKIRAEVKEKVEKALEKAHDAIEKARIEGKKGVVIREPIVIKPGVKVIRITT